MKKKICILAFMLCILSCGVILSACGSSPILEFKEDADLSREYNGLEISTNEVLEIINIGEEQDVDISFYHNGASVDSPKNVGEYKVKIKSGELTIEDEFSITPKILNNQFEVEYNGSTFISKALTSDDGIISNESVTIEATFDSKNVGEIATDIELVGEDKGNYQFAENSQVSIIPKAIIGNFDFNGIWIDGTTARTWYKDIDENNGLIEGEVATVFVTMESRNINSAYSVTITGTDASNYSIKDEQVTVDISLKLTFTSSSNSNKKLSVYVKYGDNKIYTAFLNDTLLTSSNLETFGEVAKIYSSYESNISELVDLSTMTLRANATCSSGSLTDANGNWLIVNGSDANTINFLVDVGA